MKSLFKLNINSLENKFRFENIANPCDATFFFFAYFASLFRDKVFAGPFHVETKTACTCQYHVHLF